MRYTLQALLLSVAVFCTSMKAFGPGGIFVALLILGIIVCARSNRAGRRKAWKVGWAILLLIMLAGMLVALFLPQRSRGRETIRQERCADNLRKIATALRQYHDDHGSLPPAYISDAEGDPMHSWRVLILPYIGHGDLFDQYDFNQRWDSPGNLKLSEQRPEEYACPSHWETSTTNYVAVVGPETAWPETASVRLQNIRDGADATILVVEVAGEAGIHWMDPSDLPWDLACRGLTGTREPGLHLAHYFSDNHQGAQAAFADGTARCLPEGLPSSTIKALLTINGGEAIDVDACGVSGVNEERKTDWGRLIALVFLVLSVAILARCKLPASNQVERERSGSALSA